MKKSILLLAVILIIGAFFRLYRLGSIPISPYWEEVALGYDAYSIAKTGKDFHGNSYPLIAFPSYGDYKPSGYFYLVAPFVELFGLTTQSVRLPSALAGILSIILLYLIGRELFGIKVGLVSAALFAISPWAIQFSRGGWEVNVALTLVLLGLFLLMRARRYPWLLAGSVFFFCLSMYTYHASRLLAPMVGGAGFLVLLYIWRRQSEKLSHVFMPVLAASTILLVMVMPFLINLRSETVSSRFTQTTVLNDLDPVLKSNAQIQKYGGGTFAKLIYHRYWYYGAEIVSGWIKHFSVDFLFVRGDGNYRHWSGKYGLLYPLDLVFLAVTFGVFIFANKDKKLAKLRVNLLLVAIWIALAAFPAALVKPTPHALRFLFAAPGFILLSSVGIVMLLERLPRKSRRIFGVVVLSAYLYLFASYYYWYLNIYPSRSAADWQYGYSQVLEYISEVKIPDEKVYMTRDEGRPSMFHLFYSNYDPAKIQTAGPMLPKDQLELLQVDDYYFVDTVPNVHGLFATPANKVGAKAKVLNTIRRPDGSVVWVIWRN